MLARLQTSRHLIGSWFMGHRGRFILSMLLIGVVIFVVLRFLAGLDLGLVVALALGVPSLVYASVQFDVAADTIKRLVELEHQLSTRRLEDAPRFMPDIIELLEKPATQDVVVLCDFPAYGAATDSSKYAKYKGAIADQPPGLVRLMCLDETARTERAKDFYRNASDKRGDWARLTEAEYLEQVTRKNREALNEQFSGARKFETSKIMPLFFWIVDDEAVFSLQRKGTVEVGFRTSDRPLVEALKEIFIRYCE